MIWSGALDAGKVDICTINTETGVVTCKWLYSDAYLAKWPREQFPEKYV
jgi:hypothetical protein